MMQGPATSPTERPTGSDVSFPVGDGTGVRVAALLRLTRHLLGSQARHGRIRDSAAFVSDCQPQNDADAELAQRVSVLVRSG